MYYGILTRPCLSFLFNSYTRAHRWDYDPMFYGLRNWRRIMVTGGTTEPPLIVRAQQSEFIWEAFDYDRQLSR